MAWLLPTGVEDPSDSWTSEANVLDGNENTWVAARWHAGGTWTGFLVLSFPCRVANELRLFIMAGPDPARREVSLYDGNAWRVLTTFYPEHGVGWSYLSFPEQVVTKVRIRVWYWRNFTMSKAISSAGLKVGCRGPLADICNFLHDVGTFFIDLASDIRDLWLVGEYLATPFENLGEFFQDGAVTCCAASGTLQDVLDALEGGITPESLLALIEDYWPALYYFITDPEGWFEDNIAPLLPDLPDWLDDPVAYITEIVNGLLPDFPDWLTDPVAWLAAMFEEHFPLLYYLIVDPGGWLLYIVGEAFGLPPYEAQSWDFILKTLFERYFPELYLLWRELQLWSGLYEREGAVGVMSELKARFYGLAERALRYVIEGVWE